VVDRLLRSRLGSNLTLVAASAAVPAAVMHFFVSEEQAPITAREHLGVMAVGSLVAAVCSITLMLAGFRRRETRAVIAGGAFAAMTLILLIHGLATPTVLIGPNGIVQVAGGLALPVGGAILTVAALPSLHGPQHLRKVTLALTVLLAAIAAVGALAFAAPDRIPAVPGYDSPEAIALLVVGELLFAVVAARTVRTYVLTRRLGDLVVVVGVVWLGFALIPVLMLQQGTWIWWTGHALEFLGVTLVGVPVALDVHRGRPSHPLVGDLPAAELVAAEEAFLGARVRVLMARLAAKDVSTEEHTRRVAEYAVQIGEHLELSPGRLRDLALAGLLHDIGKLSTPDAILTKPGRLTDAEMDIIKLHPVHGDDLARELGYGEAIRRPVRGHHERLDGSGYPDGLKGEEIDLESRILAVADVWDALVSPRVYRGAWTPGRAMALLVDESGTGFDPRCVAALRAITGVEPEAEEPAAHLRAA
jgi:putative nucleotidyltransferase with HDIG domain